MRRIVLVLLALAVLVPTVVQAAVWYRCAHDKVVRRSCCCGAAAHRPERDRAPEPRLEARSCCEVTHAQAPAPVVRAAAPSSTDACAPAVVPEVAVAAIAPPRPVPAVRFTTSPPSRPPDSLLDRRCALLL